VGQQVEGSRVWRVPLVPEGPGTWHLPALEIPYFDPAAGEYRVARSARLELTAHRPRQGTSPGRHPIRSAALPAEGALSPWSGLMPWLFAAPWLLALVVAAARRRPGVAGAPSPAPVHGDPRRRFEARLATAAGQERPRQAAREIEEAWRELLAVVAAVPREQPAAAWPRLLAARDPAAGDDMAGIIEDLHYLRYAPQLSAIASLRGELVDRSARLGRRLANGSGRRRR
jgi:hypothetical protein